METDLIKAIAELSGTAVLIYMVIKQQMEIDKLLITIIQAAEKHQENLTRIAERGAYCRIDTALAGDMIEKTP